MNTDPDAKSEAESSDPRAYLAQLRVIVDEIGTASMDDVGMYGCVLRAAVVKAFEFALLLTSEDPLPHSFFLTSTLRGICEDLITLTFISDLSPEDRNEALNLLMSANINDGIISQAEFFLELRPWQPVLKPRNESETNTQELRELAKKLGWNGKQPWPSVWYMAKVQGLEAFYRYLYSATSKWVHFSPQVLLRMGWGGSKDDLGSHTKWKFTTSHFLRYYTEFNRVYSLLLLLKLMRGPAAHIIPAEAVAPLNGLKQYLDELLRWPEAVTFEELNFEGPSPFMRTALRMMHESKKKK